MAVKYNKELNNIEKKIKRLIGLHLDGIIEKDAYEDEYIDLVKAKEDLVKSVNKLSISVEEEKVIKERLKIFRKFFDSNEPLTNFSKEVFESIVEKIILGGVDDNGNKDPHKLTFIFKTGLTPTISMKKKSKKTIISDIVDEGKDLCSQLAQSSC